jgi:hypothetical protein
MKGLKLFPLVIACLLIVSFGALSAPPHPTSQFFYDESGARNAIQSRCRAKGDALECSFYQMSVSYSLNPKELQASLDSDRERIEAGDPEYKKVITNLKELCSQDFSGEAGESVLSMMEDGKKGRARLIMDLCNASDKAASRKAELAFFRLTREHQATTCKVWPNVWTESFKLQQDLSSGVDYWLARSEASGDCGVISVSTLKKGSRSLWKYDSQRLVTNPSGLIQGYEPCSGIEERKVFYGWQPKTHAVDCKTIEFGF